MVVLDEGGEGSEASVESTNLITGANGRCHAKPEIYTNCEGIKTSIGQIIESLGAEKIYYLQTRGLDPTAAVKTILNGFHKQAIDLVNYKDLKEELEQIFFI